MKGLVLLHVIGFSLMLWMTRNEPVQVLVWFGVVLIGGMDIIYALEMWLSTHPFSDWQDRRERAKASKPPRRSPFDPPIMDEPRLIPCDCAECRERRAKRTL